MLLLFFCFALFHILSSFVVLCLFIGTTKRVILHTLSSTSFYMIFKEKSHKLYHKILSFLFKNGQKVTCKLCHILSNKVYICLFLHLYLYRFYTASVYSTTIYSTTILFLYIYTAKFFYSTTIYSLFIDCINSFL